MTTKLSRFALVPYFDAPGMRSGIGLRIGIGMRVGVDSLLLVSVLFSASLDCFKCEKDVLRSPAT